LVVFGSIYDRPRPVRFVSEKDHSDSWVVSGVGVVERLLQSQAGGCREDSWLWSPPLVTSVSSKCCVSHHHPSFLLAYTPNSDQGFRLKAGPLWGGWNDGALAKAVQQGWVERSGWRWWGIQSVCARDRDRRIFSVEGAVWEAGGRLSEVTWGNWEGRHCVCARACFLRQGVTM
jgi:hypothetical protein